MGPYSSDPAKIRSFLRFEMVDGRVLYAMQVRAPATEFKLCPCDPRMKAMLAGVDFRILTDMRTIPCFADAPQALPRFLAKLEAVWASLGAKVGSVEAFLPPGYLEDGDGRRLYSPDATLALDEPVVFEMNFNSNYNEAAEEQAKVSGAAAVVAMLKGLASQPPPTLA